MRATGHKSAIAIGTLALATAICLPGAASAAERITLANGFDLICNRHQFVDGKVRIYLRSSQPDYFELSPETIAGYETVQDPVSAPPGAETAPTPQTFGTPPSQGFVTGHSVSRTEKANPPRTASAPAQALPAEHLTPDDLHKLLAKPSAQHHLDEDLLASVVKAESGGYTGAVSRAGARGLMQLMPGTARQLGVQDSFAPEQNLQGGTAYLDALLTRYHDNIPLALAAYNAGPEAVDRYRGIPPYRETQAYVARVIQEFNRRVIARRGAARLTSALAANRAAGRESGRTMATSGNAGTGSD